ncbi:MAG: hypothetical protein L6277_11375 [Desulfobacterales bacterium]|nr:hypothetical protein [Pseudomonadota bacterium]MCG2772672.1 hypothetical protein [Desulfobacterales bacterium]
MVLGLGLSTHSGPAMAAPVNPIVAFNDFFGDSKPTGYLLGGSAGGQWLKPQAVAGLIPGGESYRLYTLTGEVGNSVGGKPAKGEDACTDALYVTLTPFPAGRGVLVAVAGPWNSMPRRLKIASPEAQVYREAAAEILRSQGIVNPKVNLTQVLQVDLDGDGVEEVLVSATNYQRFKPEGGLTPDARAGDYSLVFLRQVVQGQVVTRIIAGEYYPKAKKFTGPSEHRIIGVLDLNGDGIMEIVLSGRYYEGDWVDAYRVHGAKIIKLFSMGCGH